MRLSSCFRRALAGLFFLAGGTGPLLAQGNGNVTGTVTDAASGRVLEGVRIRVAGTALQASTDLRGVYRLSNVPAGDVRLQANRIGYRSVEKPITVGAGETVTSDISLSAAALTLDEVVVTGTAGDQTRRAQGATVADLSVADVLKNAPVRTVEQVLQSRVPGVSVTLASGTSGANSHIRIRGASSISLSNEPLIFVDGVQITTSTPNLFFTGGQSTGRLSELNPQDFESVEIVKGPAAATLYGANASAGVIQIITKKGRQGSRFSQSVAVGYGILDPNFTPPANYAFCTVGLSRSTSTNPLCRGQDTTSAGPAPAASAVTNVLVSDNPLVRENAFRDGNSADVQWTGRGGGQNFGYYVSLNYGTEDGTTPNNAFDRRSGRLNYNWTPSSKLTFDASVGLMRNTFVLPDNDNNVYGYLGGGLLGTPLTRRDDNGGSDGFFGAERDVAAIRSIENEQQSHRTIASITGNWVPTNWWTHRVTIGSDWLRDEIRRFLPKNARGSFQGISNTGDISERREGEERYTADYLTNVRVANTALELVHNFSAGAQIVARRNENVGATGQGITVNSNNIINAASSKSATQDFEDQRQIGFIGQYQATWKDRLSGTAGLRVDANSSFGDTKEYFYLPKLGLSYVVSEEAFFRDNIPFFNTFRLRTAWGQTGRSPTPGAALSTLDPAPYVLNAATNPGAIPSSPGNDSLKAERGVEIEAGFDAGMLNDRIGLELTYFRKTSKDLLLQKPLPPSQGYPAPFPFVNIGELVNQGFEVGINAQPVQLSNLIWDVRLGFNTLDSKITDMGDVAAFGTLNRFEEGYEPGMFVGLRIRSINPNNVSQCGPVTYTTPGPCIIVSDDFERIGPVLPTFEGNFSTNLTLFRDFNLFGLVDWKNGNYLYNLTDFFRETQLVRSNRRLDPTVLPQMERLRRYGNPTPGQAAFVREGVKSGFPATATVNEVRDGFVQKADFVKLREISLSYSLPVRYASYFRAQEATITVAGRNLNTWTDYEGFDPELLSNATSNFGRQDFLTIPPSKQFTLKMNLTF
jgi:TonB-linked SusC/RagA family outer membrane protein